MFKSSVKFTIGGREVPPSQFGNAFKDTVNKAAKEQLQQKIEAVVCPVHGQHAEVASIEASSTGWSYSISGCCDAVKDEVENAFREK